MSSSSVPSGGESTSRLPDSGNEGNSGAYIQKLEKENRELRKTVEYFNSATFERGVLSIAKSRLDKSYMEKDETIATLEAKVATLSRKLEMMSEGVSRSKRSLDESFENLASLEHAREDTADSLSRDVKGKARSFGTSERLEERHVSDEPELSISEPRGNIREPWEKEKAIVDPNADKTSIRQVLKSWSERDKYDKPNPVKPTAASDENDLTEDIESKSATQESRPVSDNERALERKVKDLERELGDRNKRLEVFRQLNGQHRDALEKALEQIQAHVGSKKQPNKRSFQRLFQSLKDIEKQLLNEEDEASMK